MGTGDVAIGTWLGELGSGSPTPGGGAAAGVAAATGAALIAMVGHLTVGKEGFEDLDARMRSLVETADAEREAFLALADEDAQAFESVMASFGLPKGTDEEKAARTMRIQEAYEGAAAVPLELADRSVRLMELAEDATAMGNPHAASDGFSGGTAPVRRRARGDGERPDQRRRPEGRGEGTGPRRPVRHPARAGGCASAAARGGVPAPPVGLRIRAREDLASPRLRTR